MAKFEVYKDSFCSCIFKTSLRLIIRLIGWIKKFDKDGVLRKIFERLSTQNKLSLFCVNWR